MTFAHALTAALVLGASSAAAQSAGTPRVRLETEAGTILLELDPERAPVTAANFVHYVREGLYDGGDFFRTVRPDNQPDDSIKIAVIQGTSNRQRRGDRRPPIPLERTSSTGLRHADGCLSMARGGPDTAVSDFFICVGDQPELDFGGLRNPDGQGFAVFGRVLEGMDVVRRIQAGEAEGQRLVDPVVIIRATLVSDGGDGRDGPDGRPHRRSPRSHPRGT